MENLRFKLPNVDRVGLVLDISWALAERRINIISMEVEPNTTYVELAGMPENVRQEIGVALKSIPQVLDVVPIDWMPHQLRTEQLKAVMSAVSDGIVAIDAVGVVTQYNPAAEQILHIPAGEIIGRPLTDFLPADLPLLDTLNSGASYDNREIVIAKTNSHYLASGRPIFDNQNRIIGAVSVLKDISEVREMVQSMTASLPDAFGRLLHESTAMKRIVAMARTIARGDSTVLIRGETGTGKELFARAIHETSPRADRMFMPVNCAAIPDNLLESELFGYEEGSFTGAIRGGKKGIFEFADGGTILLDEVAELSSTLQAKLLRVLQDGKVRRVGGTKEIPVQIRLIAATNRNLEDLMARGLFREDLFYRLNVIPLFLPPLRDRPEDIHLLVESFLKRFAARFRKPVLQVSEAAMAQLIRYSWPGNIRELENVIERAVNLADGPMLQAEHVTVVSAGLSIAPAYTPVMAKSLGDIVSQAEREELVRALATHHTSRQLGEALGLSHTAVLKKMKKYGLVFSQKKK